MSVRYQHLIQAVDDTVTNSKKIKPFRIMEIGVFDGVRGRQMIDRAVKNGRTLIEYYGFDLFEDMTAEINESEMGKRARAKSYQQVTEYLTRKTKAKVVKLFKGDTKVTLPEAVSTLPTMDVIFIDGGQSLGTIQSDFEHAIKLAHAKTAILLDGYYPGDYTKGCAFLVDTDLSKRSSVITSILEPADVYPESGLTVHFVRLSKTGLPDDSAPQELPAPPAEIFLEPVVEAPAAQEVPAEPNNFQAENSLCNPDLQSSGVCATGCGDSSCERGGQHCNGSGRCKPRVEGQPLGEVPEAQAVATSIPEERQEPDQKLELGVIESKGTENTDNGGDEQRRDVPEGVVDHTAETTSKRARRSRRSRNKRSGSPPEATDSQPDEDL